MTSSSQYFTVDDFQIMSNDSMFDYKNFVSNPNDIPESRRYPLNFTSTNSKNYMIQFFTSVLDHINNRFSTKKHRFKEVVPSFSTDEESEYPYSSLCGYSTSEITAYISYLQTSYHSLTDLNKRWNPNNIWPIFNSFYEINPKGYNWNGNNNVAYLYPAGRTDFINFRTNELSNFMESLALIAHNKEFQIGLQLGSIYDDLVENRGWVDPTKIFEKMNAVHVADVYQYSSNFEFGADYLRSLCKFWTITINDTNHSVRFSTETNWPGYNGQNPNFLSQKWTEQLVSYYNKGASEHYIVLWDISTDLLDSCKIPYSIWRNTLLTYSNAPTKQVENQYAVHMGCEQIFQNHNIQDLSTGRFEIYNSVIASDAYINTWGNYDGNKDIITNYMVEKNPLYVNIYNSINFTKASEYITNKAYLGFMKSIITKPYSNVTWFLDNGHSEYCYTQGLYNEYYELRSPIHLIWREREDLQAIWSDANLPLPQSGHTEDFISWALNYGCGYSNQPSAREYPGWEIRDNGISGNYKYDNNIRTVWNKRNNPNDLGIFLYAHSTYDNSWNIITWSKLFGYNEESQLIGYNHWPYVGDF
ncbi:MAG: hypothetical protein WAV89_06850 [Ignavibacteriaceae bacterium]